MPLHKNPNIEFYRHMAFSVIGGFLGAYAILCRCGVLANAQTMNLLEMVIDALYGRGVNALLHFVCFLIYIFGTMLTVLLPHLFHADMHRLSPIITAGCVILLGFLPEDMPVIVGLYPIFFAMSIQWSSFTGGWGFNSSSIFSTNNTKQMSLAFAQYLCDKDTSHFRKVKFYAGTLASFHIGAVISFFAVKWFSIQGAWLVLPWVAWAYYMAVCERKYEAAQAVPQ